MLKPSATWGARLAYRSLPKIKSFTAYPEEPKNASNLISMSCFVLSYSNFLNIAKRSAFENANMVIVFEKRDLITSKSKDDLLKDLEDECKMISGFIRSLQK